MSIYLQYETCSVVKLSCILYTQHTIQCIFYKKIRYYMYVYILPMYEYVHVCLCMAVPLLLIIVKVYIIIF